MYIHIHGSFPISKLGALVGGGAAVEGREDDLSGLDIFKSYIPY